MIGPDQSTNTGDYSPPPVVCLATGLTFLTQQLAIKACAKRGVRSAKPANLAGGRCDAAKAKTLRGVSVAGEGGPGLEDAVGHQAVFPGDGP